MFISKISRTLVNVFLLGVFVFGFSKEASAQFIVLKDNSPKTTGNRVITPSEFKTFKTNHNQLSSILSQAQNENDVSIYSTISSVNLPMPDGTVKGFNIVNSPIFERELQDKFPEIQTFSVVDPENHLIRGRIDISPYGFHGVIRTESDMIYIDPFSFQNTEYSISYYRSNFTNSINESDPFSCEQTETLSPIPSVEAPSSEIAPEIPIGSMLRTYRLALATTGEYTTYHGGTVAQALAAMTTSINRVNEVYENDLAVRLILVANTNILIETNSATDPYTNGTTGTMINEAQTEITTAIGSANFDIGHLFGTNSGGLAGLGVVCNNFQKARGVTGSANPVNDPFDIDYVCHEIGHQFGAEHNQNNTTCNRSANSAYEPGSGATIMAYAGICAPNLQNNSDPFFNTHSIEQIENTIDGSATCNQTIDFSNTPPSAIGSSNGLSIPISTPFELTGNGFDADGDVLTYNWEEHDLGPGTLNLTELNNPTGTAPIFRSWNPTTNKTRVFPRIQDLVNNTTVIGELLPTYDRELNFRFTVRDNHVGSGGYDFADVQLNVNSMGGPFLVNVPNGGETIAEYSMTTVTWDVANTNLPVFNSPNVDIFLSLDGGLTYPITLAQGEANDGSATFQMPLNILPAGSTQINTARIKIKSATNVFFDISNNNFIIKEPDADDFALEIENDFIDICSPNTDSFQVDLTPVLDFSEVITLSAENVPGDAEITFSSNPTDAGDSVIVTVDPNTLSQGNYNFDLKGTSFSGIEHTIPVSFSVATSLPDSTILNSPADLATNVPFTPLHQWNDISNASLYHIQVATDSLFMNLVADDSVNVNSWTTTTAYISNEEYFWKVKVINGCGESDWSDTNRFTTSIDNPVSGCTDPTAVNYNAAANIDDGSCIAPVLGCTNPDATNYDPAANSDDGSCIVEGCTNPDADNYDPVATNDDGSCVIYGCTDSTATNYNPDATLDNGSCIPTVLGCTNVNSFNYNAQANTDDGTCVVYIFGCTDSNALNYNPNANVDDNTCNLGVLGCTDPDANNYDPTATVDNGSCTNESYWLSFNILNDTIHHFVLNKLDTVPYITTHWTPGDGTPTVIQAETFDHYFETDGEFTFHSVNYIHSSGAYVFIDTIVEVDFRGCTDPYSSNYSSSVIFDDGSCTPHILGCTNPNATNYNMNATLDNNTCLIEGCTDPTAFNYNSEATVNDGSCIATVEGCTDSTAFNYNPNANTNDGSCEEVIEGCTDPLAFNYNPNANSDNGSCEDVVYGCTDINALNYNTAANTDDGSCEIDPDLDSTWMVTSTSENHTILVPDSVEIDLNGNPIANGDLIGVFYDKDGELQCAGKITWEGTSATITVYGDDYPTDNGFEDTEEFVWKIWDDSEQTTFNVQPDYIMTLPNHKYYYDDGISGVSKLNVGDAQDININEGWNFISTNIIPFNTGLEDVFSEISSDIELVKDETGQVYWPEYNINNIGDISIGKAYKVYAENDMELKIYGNDINPSIHTLQLDQGWSYIGYLRSQPANIISVLGSISSDLFIIKNLNGQVYWPGFGINTIGNMEPGEGYQINMTNASAFTFPSNSASLPVLKTNVNPLKVEEYNNVNRTSNHMHMALPLSAWKFGLTEKDEIGVFNSDNILVGSAVFNHVHLSLTIFGEDDIDNAELNFKYWNSTNKEHYDVLIDNKETILYEKDKALIVNSIQLKKGVSTVFNIEINQNHNTLETVIESDKNDLYTVKILNIMGQELISKTVEIINGVSHIQFEKSKLSTGVYLFHFDSETNHFTEKVVIK